MLCYATLAYARGFYVIPVPAAGSRCFAALVPRARRQNQITSLGIILDRFLLCSAYAAFASSISPPGFERNKR